MVDVKCAEVLYIPGVMTPTEVRVCFERKLYIISNLQFFRTFPLNSQLIIMIVLLATTVSWQCYPGRLGVFIIFFFFFGDI